MAADSCRVVRANSTFEFKPRQQLWMHSMFRCHAYAVKGTVHLNAVWVQNYRGKLCICMEIALWLRKIVTTQFEKSFYHMSKLCMHKTLCTWQTKCTFRHAFARLSDCIRSKKSFSVWETETRSFTLLSLTMTSRQTNEQRVTFPSDGASKSEDI